jgi:hypothetical protein
VPRDKDFRNVAFQMCNPSASPKPQTSWGRSRNMTTIPRDSDILDATAFLALVLVIGLVRVFGS